MDASPERGEWTVFSRHRFQQDRFREHGESRHHPCGGGDGWRQRLVRWPGRGWKFNRTRTLRLARRRRDVESRHSDGRRGSGFGHVGDLQPPPGGKRDFLCIYPAARAVLLDRWPEFCAADYTTERGPCIGELPAQFERQHLSDLSRRVCGGAGAQRDVCVGGRCATRQQWKPRASR